MSAASSAFADMLATHLAGVRALKARTGAQGVRFTFPNEAMETNVKVRGSWMGDEVEREKVRQARRNKVWRKRFDPEGVRRLCGEVLEELS